MLRRKTVRPENAIEATRSTQRNSGRGIRTSSQPKDVLTCLMETSDDQNLVDFIEISVKQREKRISVRDCGIGMNKEGLERAVAIGWPKTNDTESFSGCIKVCIPENMVL